MALLRCLSSGTCKLACYRNKPMVSTRDCAMFDRGMESKEAEGINNDGFFEYINGNKYIFPSCKRYVLSAASNMRLVSTNTMRKDKRTGMYEAVSCVLF